MDSIPTAHTPETAAEATETRPKLTRSRRLTRREQRDAHWIFAGTTRQVGKDRVWVRQRDLNTGVTRYVSTSPSGKSVIRRSLR